MGNLNYRRSRSREIKLKNELEKEGHYSIRASGSKGLADVIAIKPSDCGQGSCFSVRFIQVKVSEKIMEEKIEIRVEESSIGLINIEYHKFPVKTKKWHANNKKRKAREKLQSRK